MRTFTFVLCPPHPSVTLRPSGHITGLGFAVVHDPRLDDTLNLKSCLNYDILIIYTSLIKVRSAPKVAESFSTI